ncbi:MAG: phospholipase [Chlorobiaceae bacterium]|nr:phospholipase [Chlorobiaceae bacterium]
MLARKQNIFTYLEYGAGRDEQSPLLVLLHGFGSNEEDLIGLAPALDSRLRIISVRAPLKLGEEMYGWFPIEFTPYGITVDHDSAGRALGQLMAFLREIISSYRPQGGKVFLMGFSQGAVMNYLTAFNAPELLHGVIALSGRMPDSRPEECEMPLGLESLPFLVVHGLYDDVLPIANGRDAGQWLKENLSDVTYREYPMAHQINDDALNLVASWLRERINNRIF